MEIKKMFRYIVLILVLYSNYAVAQTITYYALIKIDEYGNVDLKCDGGQFVSISKNICFDADVRGNDIGNGKLYREVNNQNSDHIYMGDCFHGKGRYLFNTDYSTLIVEINPHYKYYYKKAPAPSEVYTCSLIKHGGVGSGSTSSEFNYGSQLNNNHENTGNSPYINNTQNFNNGNGTSTTQSSSQFKCAYCNGTGRIEKNDNAPASYGNQKPRQQCHECGKWFDPNVFVHYHQHCRHCGGTGKMK